MTETPKPTMEQSITNLRSNPYFEVVLDAMENEREAAIAALSLCKDDFDLKRLSAEIGEKSELLARFGRLDPK